MNVADCARMSTVFLDDGDAAHTARRCALPDCRDAFCRPVSLGNRVVAGALCLDGRGVEFFEECGVDVFVHGENVAESGGLSIEKSNYSLYGSQYSAGMFKP